MKNVLVIGYVWPEPNSSAAGSHMMSILRLFKQQNWQVTFATPAQPTEHMFDLTTIGIETTSITLNCNSFDKLISALMPDIVLFDRFMMEEQFGWRVDKHCPQAIKVLDTEDLQCLRQARHTAFKANREMVPADLLNSDLAKREIAAILRCDISLIVSDYEIKLLTETFKIDTALLHHLPFMINLETHPKETLPFESRQHFISIGNFRHAPNWDMVLYLQQLWPDIHKTLPNAELHIYGAYPPPKATALHNPKTGFLVKGWAEDALAVIEQARICLAPIRFGAGIKGKLIDAMMMQTPSITTPIGAEGMQTNTSWPGAIADTSEQFVEAAVSLYQNKPLWQTAQLNANSLLKAKFNGSVLAPLLIKRLETLSNSLEQHRLNNFTGNMLKHHTLKSTQYMSQWIAAKNATLAQNKP